MCSFVFFVFKQKTAYEMRISDWSSDVCSSDLRRPQQDGDAADQGGAAPRSGFRNGHEEVGSRASGGAGAVEAVEQRRAIAFQQPERAMQQDRQIGRASWRERVCQYV